CCVVPRPSRPRPSAELPGPHRRPVPPLLQQWYAEGNVSPAGPVGFWRTSRRASPGGGVLTPAGRGIAPPGFCRNPAAGEVGATAHRPLSHFRSTFGMKTPARTGAGIGLLGPRIDRQITSLSTRSSAASASSKSSRADRSAPQAPFLFFSFRSTLGLTCL